MDIPKLLSDAGLEGAEVVGAKGRKSVARVYTEEHGWSYIKIGDDQQELADFAANLSQPKAARKPVRISK